MSEVETGALGPGRIEPRELEQEMRSSFLDYAMSVIVSRALPDVRDGLKPVHLRTAGDDEAARAEVQARSARAYGFDADDFAHVLHTFPLVPEIERRAALDAFVRLVDAI